MRDRFPRSAANRDQPMTDTLFRVDVPPTYRSHDAASLGPYLAGIPDVAKRLGGGQADWTVEEVGDGNLNLVFIVRGPVGGLVVKQALPYVRLVGESWPLPLERAFFEHEALVEHARHAPGLGPAIHHYDGALFLIVMEMLEPHIIMRRGMIAGVRYPGFSDAISRYMARTLFFTSDLALKAHEKKARAALFSGNVSLCNISEQLIFTEPYIVHRNNWWTSPELDDEAAAIRADVPLKAAVADLKYKFLTESQALLHGDLHTGSVMVTAQDTRIIDPEFAFYGPMGFDVGAVLGNLLLNFFSQDGHARDGDDRADYKAWVLETTEAVWRGFDVAFRALWRDARTGDAYPAAFFEDAEQPVDSDAALDRYMRALFRDALGFAGAKMIRRILGLAHNIDFEQIADKTRRAACERPALQLGRALVLGAGDYADISDVIEAARRGL